MLAYAHGTSETPRLGEAVAAFTIVREGAELDADAVRAHCHGTIAHYQVPTRVRFVDEFPMTVTGKVQKFKLRELLTS